MIDVVPKRDVVAEKLAAHTVIQAGALVVYGGCGKIVKQRPDEIESSRRFQDRGVVTRLQFARATRGRGFVTGAGGAGIWINFENVRGTSFRPAGRVRLENGNGEFRFGVVVAREKTFRVREKGAAITSSKNPGRSLFLLVGKFTNPSDGPRTILRRRLGSGPDEMINLFIFLARQQRKQIGIFWLIAREAAGSGDYAAQRIVIGFVGGGASGAAVEHDASRNTQRVFGNVLVNGVVGKARESVNTQVNFNFSFVRVAQFQQTLGKILHFRDAEAARIMMLRRRAAFCRRFLFHRSHFEKATPTLTFRNREGDAPCPVPMVCMGWPLPQFGVPHRVQCSREQIASQLFQNSVVMPL